MACLDGGEGDAGGGDLCTRLTGGEEFLHFSARLLRNTVASGALGRAQGADERLHGFKAKLGGQSGESLFALRGDFQLKLGDFVLGRLKFY